MSRLTVGLCAGIVTVALLAGCGPDRSSRPGGGTASPTRARPTRPPDNGIAAKSVKEILAATERAFRSARSVQVKVTFKDRADVGKANLTLTHKQDLAAGWFEQQGVRMSFRVAGGRFYFRGRRFWAKQGNAELAKLIGDRWVLVPRSVAGELTPLGDDFTIDGLADELFSSKDRPRFIRKGRATVGGCQRCGCGQWRGRTTWPPPASHTRCSWTTPGTTWTRPSRTMTGMWPFGRRRVP